MLASLLCAAGCHEKAKPASSAPIVGVLELPISLRNADAAPANPLRIEVSPTEMRLDGRNVLDLQSGRAPEAERRDDMLPRLRAAIQGGGVKKAATVRMHVDTPYETLVAILNTLRNVGVDTIAFAVRKGATPQTGWMTLSDVRVQQPSDQPVEFVGHAQRQWDEFVKMWDSVQDACLKDQSVDCDPKPEITTSSGKHDWVVPGGSMVMTLLAKGNALKLSFERSGPAEGVDGGTESDKQKALETLLRRLTKAVKPGEEPPPALATEAAFTWRFPAATESQSPISIAVRPLCGVQPCGAVVTSDYLTPSMRVLSFIGAAFPNGTPAPSLVFERPRR